MKLLSLLGFVTPTFLAIYMFWYNYYDHLFLFNQFCAFVFLSIFSWLFGYYLFEIFNQETINPENKIVLVTGCDSGFGNRLAQRLDKLGFHVYAGVLFPDSDGAKELQSKCSKRLKVLKMDVTKQDEVIDVVEQIKKQPQRLWAVVNNAGIAISVPFDWGKDVECYQKTLDVNLFGVIRVSKYCGPLLRESKGRIINVASIAGRVTLPFIGHYCMSKFSVRVLSNCLRSELSPYNVEVVTIEPTFYRTPIVNFKQIEEFRRKTFDETPENIRQAYNDGTKKQLNDTSGIVSLVTRNNIDEVVDAMIKGITLKHPKIFYRCCSYLDVLWIVAGEKFPELLVDLAGKLIFFDKRVPSLVRLINKYIGQKA